MPDKPPPVGSPKIHYPHPTRPKQVRCGLRGKMRVSADKDEVTCSNCRNRLRMRDTRGHLILSTCMIPKPKVERAPTLDEYVASLDGPDIGYEPPF